MRSRLREWAAMKNPLFFETDGREHVYEIMPY